MGRQPVAQPRQSQQGRAFGASRQRHAKQADRVLESLDVEAVVRPEAHQVDAAAQGAMGADDQFGGLQVWRDDDRPGGPGRPGDIGRGLARDDEIGRRALGDLDSPGGSARPGPRHGVEDHGGRRAGGLSGVGGAGEAGVAGGVGAGLGVALAAQDRVHHRLQALGHGFDRGAGRRMAAVRGEQAAKSLLEFRRTGVDRLRGRGWCGLANGNGAARQQFGEVFAQAGAGVDGLDQALGLGAGGQVFDKGVDGLRQGRSSRPIEPSLGAGIAPRLWDLDGGEARWQFQDPLPDLHARRVLPHDRLPIRESRGAWGL
jgi:hypothetical protein